MGRGSPVQNRAELRTRLLFNFKAIPFNVCFQLEFNNKFIFTSNKFYVSEKVHGDYLFIPPI